MRARLVLAVASVLLALSPVDAQVSVPVRPYVGPATLTGTALPAPPPIGGLSCAGLRCFYAQPPAVCQTSGNGASSNCATTPGGAGAINSVQGLLNAMTQPGDWGLLNDGTYECLADGTDLDEDAGCLFRASGTAANPIVLTFAGTPRGARIRNATTDAPTTYAQANNPTIHLQCRAYVQVLRIYVAGAIRSNCQPSSSAGLAKGIVVEGNEIVRGVAKPGDGNWAALWLGGCNGARIRGNYIHDVRSDFPDVTNESSQTGIKFYTCSDSLVELNTILRAHVVGGANYSQAGGIDDKQDAVGNTHRFNYVNGVNTCIRIQNQAHLYAEARGTRVYGNVCVNGNSSRPLYGIRMEGGLIGDLEVFNNTFAGPFLSCVNFNNPAGAYVRGLKYYNNACRGPFATHNVDTDGGDSATNSAWTLLDYDAYDPAARFRPRAATYATLAAMQAGEPWEDHGLAPTAWGFAGEATGDFTLLATSPLRSAGRAGGVPAGAPVDVGAYGATACAGHACPGSGW